MSEYAEQGLNFQTTIDTLAKYLGLWCTERNQPIYNDATWTPHLDSGHCGLLASRFGIRYRSNAEVVCAYIGDAPDVGAGSIVATSGIQGDKAAAGRMATIACASLWLQAPEQHRPVQAQHQQAPTPNPPMDERARIEAALAQFTAQDIATAMDVLTAIQQAKANE